MSSTVVHEHPGVYSAYDASGVIGARKSTGVVGVVAIGNTDNVGQAVTLSSAAEAVEVFGHDFAGCVGMEMMVRALYENGAGKVVAVGVDVDEEEEFDYAGAFAVLERVEGIDLVVCDSTDRVDHALLRESVERAAAAGRERIGIVCAGRGETTAQLVDRAGALNSERMVLVAAAGMTAGAAVAAVLAAESDPSVPLNGAELTGLTLTAHYSDEQLDQLIRGGVTPLEEVNGKVSVVRGITTRTKTNGAADATWRELTSIRIVDDVIPSLRTALRARFMRRKNTEQVRAAIRSQVIVELVGQLGREMGFTWGGDWRSFPDRPHFQWDDGGRYSSAMVRAGQYPPEMPRFAEKEETMTQEEFNALAEKQLAARAAAEPSAWSAEARAWAEENGLIEGDGSGDRKYGAFVTREQAVVLLYRLATLLEQERGGEK